MKEVFVKQTHLAKTFGDFKAEVNTNVTNLKAKVGFVTDNMSKELEKISRDIRE